MPGKHALLSASASHRWLVCTPSARFEKQFPDSGANSPFAQEGTEAHAMAEETLKRYLRTGKVELPNTDNGEMLEAVHTYADIIVEKIQAARKASPDAPIRIEQRLDFSEWVPAGFGTGDAVIISDDVLEICDLKYGKGVRVSAHENTQMRLYALGAINAFSFLYGFGKVRMTIIQPRIDNIDSEEMTVDDLLTWGHTVVVPQAIKAYAGKGDFKAGRHCKFCRAKNRCKAYADYITQTVKMDFAPNKLTDEDISAALLRSKDIKSWLDGLLDYAICQALTGKKWPGMKLVHGRAVRKITDPKRAAELLINDGYKDADIYKPTELKTITALEKLCGKKHFSTLLADVIDKPEGKPTLVSVEDKRPEFIPGDVKDDFLKEEK